MHEPTKNKSQKLSGKKKIVFLEFPLLHGLEIDWQVVDPTAKRPSMPIPVSTQPVIFPPSQRLYELQSTVFAHTLRFTFFRVLTPKLYEFVR
jgi:hypothetical protein